jgi:hypothetical protein
MRPLLPPTAPGAPAPAESSAAFPPHRQVCYPEELAEQAHRLMDQAEQAPQLGWRLNHLHTACMLLLSSPCCSLPVKLARERLRLLLE